MSFTYIYELCNLIWLNFKIGWLWPPIQGLFEIL